MTKLLVVDDDQIFQYITVAQLRRSPEFEVTQFYNAGSFLTFLEESAADAGRIPDILLLDLKLGEYSGWTILDLLQANYPLFAQITAVYVVSASVNHGDKVRAFNYPFVRDFVSKPLTSDFFSALAPAQLQDDAL